jgi:hypothetical protein
MPSLKDGFLPTSSDSPAGLRQPEHRTFTDREGNRRAQATCC